MKRTFPKHVRIFNSVSSKDWNFRIQTHIYERKKFNICHSECLGWNKLWKLGETSKILNQRNTEKIFLKNIKSIGMFGFPPRPLLFCSYYFNLNHLLPHHTYNVNRYGFHSYQNSSKTDFTRLFLFLFFFLEAGIAIVVAQPDFY